MLFYFLSLIKVLIKCFHCRIFYMQFNLQYLSQSKNLYMTKIV
jgi:hypothetical protein